MKKQKDTFIDFWISFLSFALLFSVGLFFLVQDAAKAIFFGVVGGLLFSITITLFVSIGSQEMMKHAPEDCFFALTANHLNNKESRGGMIFLCCQELIFKPHKVNLSTSPLVIAYKDIESVGFGSFPRSIRISLCNSEAEVFIVNNKKEIKRLIEEACTHA